MVLLGLYHICNLQNLMYEKHVFFATYNIFDFPQIMDGLLSSKKPKLAFYGIYWLSYWQQLYGQGRLFLYCLICSFIKMNKRCCWSLCIQPWSVQHGHWTCRQKKLNSVDESLVDSSKSKNLRKRHHCGRQVYQSREKWEECICRKAKIFVYEWFCDSFATQCSLMWKP